MTEILFGAPVKEKIKSNIIKKLNSLNKKPSLSIIQVGDRDDSNIYIRNKIKFGEEVGIEVSLHKINEDIKEEALVKEIKEICDSQSDTVIVQLPLPKHINTEKILNLIPKNKDADGLSLLDSEEENILVTPATARGVISLLKYYEVPIEGRNVVVLGRSRLAGKPIAESLQKEGAFVEVCHRETKDIISKCKEADILISATGNINLITKDFVNPDQVVIDVGINKNSEGKLVGDVNFNEVEPVVKAISPVPGGVGLLTVASLFENILDLNSSN